MGNISPREQPGQWVPACPRELFVRPWSFGGRHPLKRESVEQEGLVWPHGTHIVHEDEAAAGSQWFEIALAAELQVAASEAKRALCNAEWRGAGSVFEGRCVCPRRCWNEPVAGYLWLCGPSGDRKPR